MQTKVLLSDMNFVKLLVGFSIGLGIFNSLLTMVCFASPCSLSSCLDTTTMM